MADTSDFVFAEQPDGKLSFVGDFDGLYKAQSDPWGQSAEGDPGQQVYYNHARAVLIQAIRRRGVLHPKGIEVGCGHGHVLDCLASSLSGAWVGVDISGVAVKRAVELFPSRSFAVADITKSVYFGEDYDVVVLGQLLWYIMHKMDDVIDNCYSMLRPNGLLALNQAYLPGGQRYGADIAEGFNGTLALLLKYYGLFRLIEARYDDQLGLAYHNGLVVLRKI